MGHSATIQPKLAAEPLRHRRDDESWLDWASESYAHTLAELRLTTAQWEATFGSRRPGAGYTVVLEAQARRLAREIDTAAAAAAAVS